MSKTEQRALKASCARAIKALAPAARAYERHLAARDTRNAGGDRQTRLYHEAMARGTWS